LQQGYLQQNLQTLAGQSITLPQVAMAAQHFQHLQDSNQNVKFILKMRSISFSFPSSPYCTH